MLINRKEAEINYDNVTVREAVQDYTKKHPKADSHEVAEALQANQKTVYVYMKGYAEKRKDVNGHPKNVKIGAPAVPDNDVVSRAVLSLQTREAELVKAIEGIKMLKEELSRVRAALAALK